MTTTPADILRRGRGHYGAADTADHRDRVAGGPIGLHRERRASQVDESGRPGAGHRARRVRGPERSAHQDGNGARRHHVLGHAQVQARRAVHAGHHRVRPVREYHRAAHIAVSVRGRSPTAAEVGQQPDRGQRRGRALGQHRVAVGPGRRQGEPVGRRGRRPPADGVRVRHGHRRSKHKLHYDLCRSRYDLYLTCIHRDRVIAVIVFFSIIMCSIIRHNVFGSSRISETKP